MKNRIQNITAIAATLAALTIGAFTLQAAPPKAVADMTKKELKQHKRDISEYNFDTQRENDKKNGLVWLQSPAINDPSTPAIGYYFRGGFKDGKIVAVLLIVTHTHLGYAEYDRHTSDYTSLSLNGLALPTEVGQPQVDPNADTITPVSQARLTESILQKYKDTGLYIKAKNTFGETDIPVKAAAVASFLESLEKTKKKLNK